MMKNSIAADALLHLHALHVHSCPAALRFCRSNRYYTGVNNHPSIHEIIKDYLCLKNVLFSRDRWYDVIGIAIFNFKKRTGMEMMPVQLSQ
jgi:hypothetical protein